MKPQVLLVIALVLAPPALALAFTHPGGGPVASTPNDAESNKERLAKLLADADKQPLPPEGDPTQTTTRPLTQAEHLEFLRASSRCASSPSVSAVTSATG